MVYQAAVIIKRYSKESVIRLYKDMRDMLEEKYIQDEGVHFFENLKVEYDERMKEEGATPFQWKQTADKDGYEATTFFIPNLESQDLKGYIKICVNESFSNITYSTEYNLLINYSDWRNDDSQRANRMDDL